MRLFSSLLLCLAVVTSVQSSSSVHAASTSAPGCNAGDSCLDVYEPVCGTDNQTYGNDCQLKLQACANTSLKVAYKGECKATGGGSGGSGSDSSHCSSTMCLDVYEPVCGSDNKTYGNDCQLNNAKCKNPKLTLKSKGACGSSSGSKTTGGSKPTGGTAVGATNEPQKSSSKNGSKKSSATTLTGLMSLQLVAACTLVVAAWLS